MLILLMKGICALLGADYAVGCQHEADDGKAHSHDQTEQLALVTAIWTHLLCHCARSRAIVCICTCMYVYVVCISNKDSASPKISAHLDEDFDASWYFEQSHTLAPLMIT